MKTKISILACVLATFLLSAAAGCHREGAGQKADRAVAKGGDSFDDAVEKVRK